MRDSRDMSNLEPNWLPDPVYPSSAPPLPPPAPPLPPNSDNKKMNVQNWLMKIAPTNMDGSAKKPEVYGLISDVQL